MFDRSCLDVDASPLMPEHRCLNNDECAVTAPGAMMSIAAGAAAQLACSRQQCPAGSIKAWAHDFGVCVAELDVRVGVALGSRAVPT